MKPVEILQFIYKEVGYEENKKCCKGCSFVEKLAGVKFCGRLASVRFAVSDIGCCNHYEPAVLNRQ